MIKKLLALTAGAVFSMNASAGYVQYDLSGPVSGFFVQHDDDQSIAYYNFSMSFGNGPGWEIGGYFSPKFGEGVDVNTDATTYFRNNGPTNFTVYDDYGAPFPGYQWSTVHLDFARSTKGDFTYTATYSGKFPYIGTNGWEFWNYSGQVMGKATKAAPGYNFEYLDSYGGYEPGVRQIIPTYIGPNQVPEPASLALLAIGALGAAGAARRRKFHI
jgi:hypothetical protein